MMSWSVFSVHSALAFNRPSEQVITLVNVLGELVQTTRGKWIILPPSRCPNGHTLGPQQVLVGHQPCLGHGGGHTTWTCRTCDETVYGPPLNTHCTTLDGPATVRISTARD
jgi:hypothetical protein